VNSVLYMNDQIMSKIVNLIGEDGKKIGECSITDALSIASDKGFDLVQVSKSDKIPICKLMDYGKLQYKKKKNCKKAHKEVIKEIKFHLNISDHDLETKHRKVKEFLSKKYKIKYVLELRGRNIGKMDQARQKMSDNLKDFEGLATWDKVGVFEKNIQVVLKSLVK
jgi:translation initiation factor IF-3